MSFKLERPVKIKKLRKLEIDKIKLFEKTDISLLEKRPVFGDKTLINTLRSVDDIYAKDHREFRTGKK